MLSELIRILSGRFYQHPIRRLTQHGIVGLLLTALMLCSFSPVSAGQYGKGSLEQHLKKRFGNRFVLGEQLSDPAVWPVFEREDAKRTLVAWLFESIDVERVKGYSGKPINLLILLKPDGSFLDVTLKKHREPIFKSRSGTKVLIEFAGQYNALSIDHEVRIVEPDATPEITESSAVLHGISRGTVTASAIDRTVLWTAVKVAQAHYDKNGSADNGGSRRGRQRSLDWLALRDKTLVRQIKYTYLQMDELFARAGIKRPPVAIESDPSKPVIDYWTIPIALPSVGRNLLQPKAWEIMRRRVAQGRQLFLMLDDGELELANGDAASITARIVPSLRQSGQVFPLEKTQFPFRLRARDMATEAGIRGTPRLFQTAANSGFNIDLPFIVASQPVFGEVNQPDQSGVQFEDAFDLGAIARSADREHRPSWLNFWEQKRTELIILAIGLVVLSVALVAQRRLALTTRRLTVFRTAYLLFTLFFIGWYAQGQLTIVTVIAALQAFVQGEGVAFMLADPIAVLLWAFVLLTLFVWGRGTFCGWLCPFGAFQELLNTVVSKFGLGRRQLHTKVNAVFRWLKYVILAGLLLVAFVAGSWTDTLVEIEPFKTTISMSFQRSWPYVLWAVACLGLSLVVYRGYCRYLCPLGAMLAVLGRVRIFNWIPRRESCGTPCQTCRFRCTYQAIAPAGKVDYDECFQCLDCVSIYQDDKRCMPLVMEVKRAKQRTIPIRSLA